MRYGELVEATRQGYISAAAILPDGRVATTILAPTPWARRAVVKQLRTIEDRQEFALGVIVELRLTALREGV